MSDLPGEMTKQMRVAPAISIRSTRYSLTARGRSASPSKRLPTGRSSFENASGWMREPIPADGMMPHIQIRNQKAESRRRERTPRGSGPDVRFPFSIPSLNRLQQLFGAALRAVVAERALPRRISDPRELGGRGLHRVDGLLGRPRHDDLFPRLEEFVEAVPRVAQDRSAARCRFEQASRGA